LTYHLGESSAGIDSPAVLEVSALACVSVLVVVVVVVEVVLIFSAPLVCVPQVLIFSFLLKDSLLLGLCGRPCFPSSDCTSRGHLHQAGPCSLSAFILRT